MKATSLNIRAAVALTLGLLVMNTASAQGEELTAAKKADIVKLLDLNGSMRIVEPIASMITQRYEQSMAGCPNCSPKIPEVVRATTESTLRERLQGKNGLIERFVPLFHQHFSHAEIKELNTFFSTTTGKKWVQESQVLTQESLSVSQVWLQEVAPEIKRRIDLALDKAGIKPPAPSGVSAPPPSVVPPGK